MTRQKEIYDLYIGGMKQVDIARQFNVSRQCVYTAIANQKRKISRCKYKAAFNEYDVSWLEVARAYRGWSRMDVCDKIDISGSMLFSIERGRQLISSDIANQLAKLYDARLVDLFVPEE